MTWLIGAAFLLALYFPVMFYVRSDWYTNTPGKSLMALSGAIALLLGLAVLRSSGVILPEWVRAASYLLIVIVLVVQDVTLTRIQNRRIARLAREREESTR